MPKSYPTLTYEQQQELTKEDWVKLESRYRKLINRSLSDPTTPARVLSDITRAAAVAHDRAYPDASGSGLSLQLPAKLLKPIEQAIYAASKKSKRESISTPLEDVETIEELNRT